MNVIIALTEQHLHYQAQDKGTAVHSVMFINNKQTLVSRHSVTLTLQNDMNIHPAKIAGVIGRWENRYHATW